MQRILKIKHHSTFHVRSRTVLWLVLMLKVLHDIIVTVEVLQDTVQISILATHVGVEIPLIQLMQIFKRQVTTEILYAVKRREF